MGLSIVNQLLFQLPWQKRETKIIWFSTPNADGIFDIKKQKRLIICTTETEAFELPVSQMSTPTKSVECLSRNCDLNMTHYRYIYTSAAEKVGGDVIAGQKVKTINGYVVVNLRVVS